ncbi:dTDP-4-dehydrorhamnose reductase family protein [Radiobacillus sp. PE A8.2]|uniref:dTDP-4-dehydrorhamnose reductase family protein n=1 Tax=Radiobacillus sp. PE A8.2 TaxID=3380349 RepID=UPI00388DFCE2
MKLLILGGKGMAGHVIVRYFQQKPEYNVYYTSRDKEDLGSIYLDVTDPTRLEEVLENIKPDIVVNCIGILNKHAENHPKLAFQVNSLLPQQLVKLTERNQGKLIHISTDCVFLGEKGDYKENDTPDGTSFYAQSKQLGEVISDKHLTIRTSIIGPELKEDGIGLFLWFMQQKGKIYGYDQVFWNGVTTLELAKAIEVMLRKDVTGLYHLASEEKLSKYTLLKLIKDVFHKEDVEIVPDSEIFQDRSICSTRTDFHYQVPSYEDMLQALRSWMEEA